MFMTFRGRKNVGLCVRRGKGEEEEEILPDLHQPFSFVYE